MRELSDANLRETMLWASCHYYLPVVGWKKTSWCL